MAAIIVCTHGNFSAELVKSSEMIYGKQNNVGVVTFEIGEGVDALEIKYKKVMENLDCSKGVLFLVDLFGGSPFNAASRIAVNNEMADIITGVNLPMLLEIFNSRDSLKLDELVEVIKKSSKESIKSFKENIKQEEEEEL